MKAEVISPVTILGTTRQIGEVVEVDANTLTNLVRKGRLTAFVERPAGDQDQAEPKPQKKSRK